jgi:signal transduction histidine kinase
MSSRSEAQARLETLLRQQQLVADLGQQALGGMPTQALFEQAVEAVSGGLGVEYAKVLELLPGGGTLLLRAGVGWKAGLVGQATVGSDLDSQAGYTLFREHFVLVEDLATDARFNGPALLVEHGVRSGVSTVIWGEARPFGVLGAHSRSRRSFTEADAQFLRSVANVLGAAVEREDADKSAREREAFLVQAQRLGHVGSYTWDLDTETPSWSEETYRITGRDPKLPPPKIDEYLAMFTVGSQSRILESIAKYEADGQPFELDLELVRPDGEHRRVVQRGDLDIGSGRSPRIMGVLQDVTDQWRLTGQLAQAQRLEAIGRLAAGVAHDFNNLLVPIIGFSAVCLERLPADDPMREDLAEIHRAGESAAALTQQLLAVGRRQPSQPEVVDLNTIVQPLVRLLERVLGEHIVVRCDLAPAVSAVSVDGGQIEQILTNLAANARDAMRHGGTLTIQTADVILDSAYAGGHPGTEPGPHVMLAVTDTGLGMPQEVLSRAFDPFFTTKDVGAGTGLGLATVHGIAQQCHGSVDAESTVGQGTTFRLYFPAVPSVPDVDGIPDRTEPAEETPGQATILLVEDNEAVRRFAKRVLVRHGYDVLEAGAGDAALRLVADHVGALDLLVTDVVMPGIGGPALAEQLVAARPHLKIVYMSGYTGDAIESHGVLDPEVAFLHKPFTSDALAQKVHEALTT